MRQPIGQKLDKLERFGSNQLKTINGVVGMAEDLVNDYYKLSESQWLRPQYDVKTLADLSPGEIVHGPFAQIIRYVGQKKDSLLGSDNFDFYKICLQDHAILCVLKASPPLELSPFVLYIVIHELVHIVRFSKFLQRFDASSEEKVVEEMRVHKYTHDILSPLTMTGLPDVFKFYDKWRMPLEELQFP